MTLATDNPVQSWGGRWGTWLVLGVLSCIVVPVGIYLYLSRLDGALRSEALRHADGISRGAMLGYERETACSESECPCETGCCVACSCVSCDSIGARLNRGQHTLCGSALPVPSTVPDEPYVPDTRKGHDFHTGGPLTGWRCLHVAYDEPLRFQLRYDALGMAQSKRQECRDGSGLFLPKSQPWPCPCGFHGFEASASFRSSLDSEEVIRVSRFGRLNDACELKLDD